jgi:hypothetical protein
LQSSKSYNSVNPDSDKGKNAYLCVTPKTEKTMRRYFNTSGPNIPEEHYTIKRKKLIEQGSDLVRRSRYFTIWAPRQTGKSTYFRQLAETLETQGYKVAHINFENFKSASEKLFLDVLKDDLKKAWDLNFDNVSELQELFAMLSRINNKRLVLIIDEVEGINEEYFGTFLHSVRNVYHSRETHALKSVIFVGVANITGVVGDNASPFNIADNLNVPYFTDAEVYELLGQHESETGQVFENSVKDKIIQITANQPGLVNGFAQKLITEYADKELIEYDDYLQVEDWYLTEAIDKNFENIRNKAESVRAFAERLLFTESKIPFDIDRPAVKLLHINGVIKKDNEGNIAFWVPFYKKRLYKAFYPYTNGEKHDLIRSFALKKYFDLENHLLFKPLIQDYQSYCKRRGFKPFIQRDENGNIISIQESALLYSFETYIQAFLQATESKSYREADTGLGKSDLIINVEGNEYLLESKVYYYEKQFLNGKKQLAYYAESLGLNHAVYLLFHSNKYPLPESVIEADEVVNNVRIETFLVEFDDKKWD